MSAVSANYARLARKAKRLSQFTRTCLARRAQHMLKRQECEEKGDDRQSFHHSQRVLHEQAQWQYGMRMIEQIKDEMAILMGTAVPAPCELCGEVATRRETLAKCETCTMFMCLYCSTHHEH